VLMFRRVVVRHCGGGFFGVCGPEGVCVLGLVGLGSVSVVSCHDVITVNARPLSLSVSMV